MEIGDCEDEDGNPFFVSAITNIRLFSITDPVDWAVVFQDEEAILHVPWEPCEYVF